MVFKRFTAVLWVVLSPVRIFRTASWLSNLNTFTWYVVIASVSVTCRIHGFMVTLQMASESYENINHCPTLVYGEWTDEWTAWCLLVVAVKRENSRCGEECAFQCKNRTVGSSL